MTSLKLWRVFHLALEKNAIDNPLFHEAFDQAVKIWGVAINLTMGLFWIRPEKFLNMDKTNREYLEIKLPPNGLSFDFYVNILKSILERGKPLPEISYDAWLAKSKPPKIPYLQNMTIGLWALIGMVMTKLIGSSRKAYGKTVMRTNTSVKLNP